VQREDGDAKLPLAAYHTTPCLCRAWRAPEERRAKPRGKREGGRVGGAVGIILLEKGLKAVVVQGGGWSGG
jgi:hypothetical protein